MARLIETPCSVCARSARTLQMSRSVYSRRPPVARVGREAIAPLPGAQGGGRDAGVPSERGDRIQGRVGPRPRHVQMVYDLHTQSSTICTASAEE